jgi:hypothetical protein
MGQGLRSDHVEILSPCEGCMDRRASRRHNCLQTEQGAFALEQGQLSAITGSGTGTAFVFATIAPIRQLAAKLMWTAHGSTPTLSDQAARELFPRTLASLEERNPAPNFRQRRREAPHDEIDRKDSKAERPPRSPRTSMWSAEVRP